MRRVKFKVVSVDDEGRRTSAFTRGNYSLDYPENSVIRAREGTLGVAVFGTRKQAESLLRCANIRVLKIIRVRPVGRGKVVGFVCDYPTETALDNFYEVLSESFCAKMSPPFGTIFYPGVEVLE